MNADMDLTGLSYYIRERERIRLLRKSGAPYPWTTDEILGKYKFTNVRRLHDKTTQWFLKNWYEKNIQATDYEALYNCGVARYHGTVSFAEKIGWSLSHDAEWLISKAREMIDAGEQVYTGAYIVTNGGRHGFKEAVVCTFLEDLWKHAHDITSAIEFGLSWEAGYRIVVTLDGFGGAGFMAKEVLQDYILWRRAAGRPDLTDELSWTPVGPGARRGLNRLSGRPLRFAQRESKFIEEVMEVRSRVAPQFFETFGEVLTMHDVQFCLCEYDKYERVRLGEGRPRSLYHPPV